MLKNMEHIKKRRGENWSSEEKKILRQLIHQSIHIVEDKSTKTSINIMKKKEWKNISVKFNEITGKHRSDWELKLAWKRMKLFAKRARLESQPPRQQFTFNNTTLKVPEPISKMPEPIPKVQEPIIKMPETILELPETILNSEFSDNDLKQRQLEIMEVEHKLHVKVLELKIKKLELQIAELENKKNTE